MSIKTKIVLYILINMFFCVKYAHAEVEEKKAKLVESVILYFENDLFYNTDRYYTNAVQIRAISPTLQTLAKNGLLPDFFNGLTSKFEEFQNNDNVLYNVSIGMGQSIYTPNNTQKTELLKNDRPYAGHLYTFMALHAKQTNLMDTLEVSLGVVGPSALGEQAQNRVHKIRGFETAKGWNNQLKDEPAFSASWTRNYSLDKSLNCSGWNWNILPYHSITIGNVLTQAATGAELRFGYNIPNSFASPLIRAGSGIKMPDDNTFNDSNIGFYIFAGFEARLVGHNIFLDGNTWKNSHSIDKRFFVNEINYGITFEHKSFLLTYQHVLLSKEFKGQDSSQNYGSISLSIPF